jgi:hypothetical protein
MEFLACSDGAVAIETKEMASMLANLSALPTLSSSFASAAEFQQLLLNSNQASSAIETVLAGSGCEKSPFSR